jgi:UDP-glucose 4-epimerase
MRSFLVTGGAGFVGSHLVTALVRAGKRVVAIDDLSTGSVGNVAHLADEPLFEFVKGTVADTRLLQGLTSRADVVIHLAAVVGVKQIVERAVHTIETNIMGTESVLRCASHYGRRVLIASSSEVYGKGCRVPFAEMDDVLLGASSRSRWAYAATKMVDEFLGLAYHRERGLEVVPFRLFNTIGPRQSGAYGMVVPRFVRQALENEPITVYGSGNQQRCFCNVADTVRAIIGLAEHPDAPGRVFNVGSTEEVSIRALAERVRALTGSKSIVVEVPYDRAYPSGFEDMDRRIPDLSRIEALLGWQPRYRLDETLLEIIDSTRELGPQP